MTRDEWKECCEACARLLEKRAVIHYKSSKNLVDIWQQSESLFFKNARKEALECAVAIRALGDRGPVEDEK